MKKKIQELIKENKAVIKSNKNYLDGKNRLNEFGKGVVASRIQTLQKQNKELLKIIKQ